jgi:AraC family transcriptional regulator of adaptative response / DNA-3-methyladenine glycosylase II
MELEPSRCYRAALSRDPRFDGRFFTGVVTTGIYCRPVCPVAPPKFENVRFYACAAAAESAGFRPCKRCRPETAPGTPAWTGTSAVVSRGLRLISEGGLDDGNLEALASRLGLGERQLRRLFAQHLGASPLDVARARRVHFARNLIDQTELPFAEVAHAAGFQSVRQFNHALKATFGETPTALRRRRSPRGVCDSDAKAAIVVRLPYRPPLAWEAMLRFLAQRAIPGVEVVEGGRYRRTIELGGSIGAITVEHAGGEAAAPHHAPHLRVLIELPQCPNLIGVVERVRGLFDLGADPARIAEHLGRSEVLAPLVTALPGLRVPGAWDGFELAVRAGRGPPVPVRGATTLAGRLVREFGTPRADAGGALTHLFPRPAALAEADLARIGLPRARAAALRALASAVAGGELRFDAALGLEDAVERLCRVSGLGPWTAHYIAMRAMGEPDAFPETDLGIRRALGCDGAPASVAEVRAASEQWRPWRSYAAMYLWNGLAAESSARTLGARLSPTGADTRSELCPESRAEIRTDPCSETRADSFAESSAMENAR